MSSNRLPAVTAWFLVLTIRDKRDRLLLSVHGPIAVACRGDPLAGAAGDCGCGALFFQARGPWRWVYVATACSRFILNVFVLIVQMFAKFPAFITLAPTQSDRRSSWRRVAFSLCSHCALWPRFAGFVRSVGPFRPDDSRGRGGKGAGFQHVAGGNLIRSEGACTMPTITTRDGVEIFYKDWGSGQPIVLQSRLATVGG